MNASIRTRGQRKRVLTPVGDHSMTDQSFKDECDINFIMQKYEKTGLLDHVNTYQGQYGDFTDAPDYHTALNKMNDAQEMFMTVPAKIRELFNNDPGEFLEFVLDGQNEEAMREMGLLPPAPPSAPGRDDPEEQPTKRAKPAKSDPTPKPASEASE